MSQPDNRGPEKGEGLSENQLEVTQFLESAGEHDVGGLTIAVHGISREGKQAGLRRVSMLSSSNSNMEAMFG